MIVSWSAYIDLFQIIDMVKEDALQKSRQRSHGGRGKSRSGLKFLHKNGGRSLQSSYS